MAYFPSTAKTAKIGPFGRLPTTITLAQIAAAAQVTTRALQYGFRKHYDTTPLAYLRTHRLQHAHRDLRAADPAARLTVAAVARKWGWVKPSRFTADYLQHYGRVPSRTLRK